ncbi:glycosyltransferase family 4 protein [Ferrimonas balearica]|uniref:glycosyltransferase family 4 protein n=1 Tax=Ferrimonas balearica TaxID=44012 RepID=UPI001F44CCFE|nr:glycosyltransferase family 4 protein [Ferrimonas balearica]MBY6096289.1 glycosyltransferase family 4 protein [Ferrimonas balearica]
MRDAPRVLLLDLSRHFGGASSRVLGLLANYPPGRAWLGALTGSAVYREAKARGLPVLGLGQHKADPRLLSRLCRACREHQLALIDSHNIQSQFWAHWASQRCGVAHITTLNSWYADEYRQQWRGTLYARLSRWLRPEGPLIVVSDAIGQALRQQGVTAERIHLVANAVAPAPTFEVNRDELAASLALDPQRPWVLLVARLESAKRVDRFLDAMARLPEAQGIVVGEGSLMVALQAQQRQQGSDVVFTGALPHSETQQLMASSDLLVLCSDTEGTPLVLLEGAALAKPMVATAVGGIPELFDDGVEARLVPPDAAALATGIDQLLTAPEQGAILGHAARTRLLAQFSPQAQLQHTLAAYHAALE